MIPRTCAGVNRASGGRGGRRPAGRILPHKKHAHGRATSATYSTTSLRGIHDRRQNLHDRDGGTVVAEDDAKAAEAGFGSRQAEPAGELGSGGDLQEGGRFDSAQDVVIDQHTTKRNFFFDDGVANSRGTAGQVDTHGAELNDMLGWNQLQKCLTTVRFADAMRLQDFDCHGVLVMGFDRHRHVMMVNEHCVVGFWNPRGWDDRDLRKIEGPESIVNEDEGEDIVTLVHG